MREENGNYYLADGQNNGGILNSFTKQINIDENELKDLTEGMTNEKIGNSMYYYYEGSVRLGSELSFNGCIDGNYYTNLMTESGKALRPNIVTLEFLSNLNRNCTSSFTECYSSDVSKNEYEIYLEDKEENYPSKPTYRFDIYHNNRIDYQEDFNYLDYSLADRKIEDNKIKLYYKRESSKEKNEKIAYTIHYMVKESDDLDKSTEVNLIKDNAFQGDELQIQPYSVIGYELIGDVLYKSRELENRDKMLSLNGLNINVEEEFDLYIFYEPITYEYVIKYIDYDTKEDIVPEVKLEGRYGDKVIESATNIIYKSERNYSLISPPVKSLVINDDKSHNVLEFYYTKVDNEDKVDISDVTGEVTEAPIEKVDDNTFSIRIVRNNIEDEGGGWKTFVYEVTRQQVLEKASTGGEIGESSSEGEEEFVTYAFISCYPSLSYSAASITIDNLPTNNLINRNRYTYKVRELSEWSWRYRNSDEQDEVKQIAGSKKIIPGGDVEIGADGVMTLKFGREPLNNRWLSATEDDVWVGLPYVDSGKKEELLP